MTRLGRLSRRAWTGWIDVHLGIRLARWTGLAAVAGYVTGRAANYGPTLIGVAMSVAGALVTVAVLTRVARLAQASQDRERGLRVIAEQWMADTMRTADERRRRS